MRKTFAVAQTLGCTSVCLALTASIGWCEHLAKKQNDAQTEKTHTQTETKEDKTFSSADLLSHFLRSTLLGVQQKVVVLHIDRSTDSYQNKRGAVAVLR